MNVLIIDGQGGGIGKLLVAAVKAACPNVSITAVGTNTAATAAMLKAGAHNAATGENAVVVQCRSADIIVGPIGITLADAMLGEVSPRMAVAVGQSNAQRILLPTDKCTTFVVGTMPMPRRQLIDAAVDKILQILSPRE